MKFQLSSYFLLSGFTCFLLGELNEKHESLSSELRLNGGSITKLLGKNKGEILQSSVGLFGMISSLPKVLWLIPVDIFYPKPVRA